MRIVDAHHHIWRVDDLPWLYGPPVPRIFGEYGVLWLTLKADAYRWQFLSAPGRRRLDEGNATCHAKEGKGNGERK